MLSDARLHAMARDLARIEGVVAVVLGGSRARGTHRRDSDVDLGLYYEDPLDLLALADLATRWAGRPVEVAAPGRWGPWVNGGAWLTVDGIAVDWILRDLGRVSEQCERARRGELAFHPQPGHPLGFLDVAYAGEVATCVPLADDDGVLARLVAGLTPYPWALRDAMLAGLWQVDFLLDAAAKGAKAADVAYVALCTSTAAMLVAHAWHAVAGSWVTNEKALVPGTARLPVATGGFAARVAAAIGALGTTPTDLQRAIDAVRAAPRPDVG
ncbi:nucleotidyltransferase domain-containing protein [Miniimonas sp. S16]|uniref:nucleotidyltransferase domain-containing protein n=1 Tax=Miniimonas sp. S16 TaxID=2171623 RepID=UPI001F3944FC|nr:nucleotidyltransferase domain-containing protein [Miniimonas sp. S16]